MDNCADSSLILYQNSTSGTFLEICYNVESEATSVYFFASESTGLSYI